MGNALMMVFGILLGVIGTIVTILAFIYQSAVILFGALGIFAISIICMVLSLEEKTPKQKKESITPPKKIETTFKVNPKTPIEQEKNAKPKPVKPTKATILPPNTIYCTYCGKQIPKDSLFCPNCGSSLE
ncbi:MAG: zinc-ribbon domain-containing protein [Candidatus Jordarchaeaceae archaeon]